MDVRVPVVDFSALSLDRAEPDQERLQEVVDDIHRALTSVGCLYLKNHGLPAQKVQ